MNKKYETLWPYLEKARAFHTALALFEWDDETLAPEAAGPYTAKVIGTLSQEYQQVMTCKEVRELVEQCKKAHDLSETEAAIVRETDREIHLLSCIPANEYREYTELTAEGSRIWAEAKKKKDFSMFAPTLKKIIAFQKKFAAYRAGEGQKLYDVMLDQYERGFDTEHLDLFFDRLRGEIVPFLQKLMDEGKEISQDFLVGDWSDEKQETIGRFLAEYVGFDFEKGVLAVSAHPFTTNLHNHDVRITTNYNERIDDSIFSVIHEAGHGLYELGIRDDLTQTIVGEGASMAMHESQSRFFENIIGRNPSFWKPVYGKLQELFPQFGEISLETFIQAVNKVQPSLIRTQADELTYSIHVMIRYEIEKMLIEGDLEVEQLPEVWADKYEEYLGVRPQNASEGVLQDIHWSQGSFGYFPSYALGSAFGAQMYAFMKQQMDFEELLETGEIHVIREYLREHVHQYGRLKTSQQILEDMTGETFNPQYYIDYLKEKYGALYFDTPVS
ncbi:MAG: carboxypeptidase M32 [Hungatella sp.]